MKISFSPPDMTELEVEGALNAIKSGWITTGPKTKEFEKKVAEYIGVNKVVCLNSQTACGEMALRIMGIGPGDEVLVPAYTYTASSSVVCHVGAKGMPAHMGRHIRHLYFVDLVVLLPDMLHILFPMQGNHRPSILVQEQEAMVQPPLRIADDRLRFRLFTVLKNMPETIHDFLRHGNKPHAAGRLCVFYDVLHIPCPL